MSNKLVRKSPDFWKDHNNVKEFLLRLKEKEQLDSWYDVSKQMFLDNGGSQIYKLYKGRSNLLKTIFPEEEWYEWKFKQATNGFWDKLENQRRYLEWLKHTQNIESWYNVETQIVHSNYGSGLLDRYNNSLIQLLKAVYTECEWHEWKFNRAPQGFWQSIENIKRYLDWLQITLGITNPHDLTYESIDQNNGSKLLQYYKTLFDLLSTVYPNVVQYEWKLTQVPKGFWSDRKNHRKYLEWLMKELHLDSVYKLTTTLINNNCGRGLLVEKYDGSLIKLVKAVYSDQEWYEWMFAQTSQGYWDDLDNQRTYVKWLMNKLNLTVEKLYKIDTQTCKSNYGGGFIGKYNNSIIKMANTLYPEIEWYEWMFTKAPQHFWETKSNCVRYLKWLVNKLNVETYYSLTYTILKENYGGGLIDRYTDSVYKMVSDIFPDKTWDKKKFYKSWSEEATKWLTGISEEQNILINHGGRDGYEFVIPNSQYKADGYCEQNNTIYEYHGCFWHGCPTCYIDREAINPVTKTTFQKLYENTLNKKKYIESLGYCYVERWSHEG